ncbi:MAG: hypothetical protein HYX65_10055 [Gemmatimonadetes bacterium]|nr:hypothetical protein [Gemmatimonadota bacterium]
MTAPTDISLWSVNPCARLAGCLDEFVDGRLDRAIEALALAHMERCPPCRVMARHALRYRETMRRVGDASVAPADFVQRLRFALRRGVEPPPA